MPKFFEKSPTEFTPPYAPYEHKNIPNLDTTHELEPPHPHPDLDYDPLKIFLNWTAPSRIYRKKDRSYYTTIGIIVVLLSLILLIAQEYLLIAVVIALTFVVYVLNFVAPEDIDYKISSQGITIGDHFYVWAELDSFWFTNKEGQAVLHIYTNLRFPNVLMIPLGNAPEDQIRRVLSRYIVFLEVPPKSTMDKWAESLQKHFPLENPHK